MVMSNKIEKTEELITGCIWNILFSSYKDRNLLQMALTNLRKKSDLSGNSH